MSRSVFAEPIAGSAYLLAELALRNAEIGRILGDLGEIKNEKVELTQQVQRLNNERAELNELQQTRTQDAALTQQIERIKNQTNSQTGPASHQDPLSALLTLYYNRKDLREAFPEATSGKYDRLVN